MCATRDPKSNRGSSSFFLHSPIVETLIRQRASALEICAMLVIAQHTDASGSFSTASVKAISKRAGANKESVKRALESLRKRRIKLTLSQPKDDAEATTEVDLGPMLMSREDVMERYPSFVFPDKNPCFPIRFAFPTFHFDDSQRIWFGSGLVLGHGDFQRPLSVLRGLVDPAAHLLLHIYAVTDMARWGGACPVGPLPAPSRRYRMEEVAGFDPDLTLYKAHVTDRWCLDGVLPELSEYRRSLPYALEQLLDAGFVYEVVTAFSGDELSGGASPLYQLYSVNRHGYPLEGEHGVARYIAETARQLDEPIWGRDGRFDHVYGVIWRSDEAICVRGILRPRFRVTNARNGGVAEGWMSVLDRDREALRMIQSWRLESGLAPLPDRT